MKLGTYEIESYDVIVGNSTESRQRVIYYNNNGKDNFTERYNGYIRPGYTQLSSYFKDLTYDSIQSNVVGESIAVFDNSGKPLIYFTVSGLESIQRVDEFKIIIINSQIDEITLEFQTKFDTDQAYSILNYVLGNPNVDIDSIGTDTTPPIITFNDTFMGSTIYVLDTDIGGNLTTIKNNKFSISIDYYDSISIGKLEIISDMIYDISDDRDIISIDESYVKIYNSDNQEIEYINDIGSYIVEILIQDIPFNSDSINIYIDII